jgi:uncharacterized protein (TIGR02246 family)
MRSAAVALFATLVGCSVPEQRTRDGVGADAAADAMGRAWSEHIAAAERKDAAAACDLYTEDVVYAIAGSPELRGRAAVEAMEKASMATTSISGVKHWSNAVRVDGDVAHEIGTVSGNVRTHGTVAGGGERPVTFHYVGAWRHCADGKWRIAHLVGHMAGQASDGH